MTRNRLKATDGARPVIQPVHRNDPICLVPLDRQAPRMLGEEVRTNFLEGRGFFSYVSVEQDASGTAEARLMALALACGTLARGAMRLSATQEAQLDLLIEQTVGPYLGTAIQLAFDTGVANGLPPEALVLELYMSGEMSRTLQTFAEVGFYRSAAWHGLVAQYGGFGLLPSTARKWPACSPRRPAGLSAASSPPSSRRRRMPATRPGPSLRRSPRATTHCRKRRSECGRH